VNRKYIFTPLFFLCATAAAFLLWLELTNPEPTELDLRDGDILFQTDRSHQALAIFLATHSLLTHTGIVEKRGNGDFWVIEAVGPVKWTPLGEWIKRGYGKRLLVERLRGLAPEQGSEVVKAAQTYYGRPYDPYFLFDKAKLYCSSLVYFAFQDATGLALGQMQSTGELYLDNFAVRKILAQRWRSDPLCQDETTFGSCFARIKQQKLLTPASLAADSRLDRIYDNYRFLPR